jgi:hypothetical protein
MSNRRLLVVHGIILFVIAGSLYDIGTRQEHWPFSNYPMFSSVHRQPTLTWLRLFGVTDDNREVPLLKYNELWPLDQSRLPLGLRRVADQPDSGPRLQDALSDVLNRYNARREKGEIKGPELRALRLYKIAWTLEPFAANLDRPSTRQLVAETAASTEAP